MLIYLLIIVSAALAGIICLGTGAFLSVAWLWTLPLSFVGCLLGLSLVLFLLVWFLSEIIDLNKPRKRTIRFTGG